MRNKVIKITIIIVLLIISFVSGYYLNNYKIQDSNVTDQSSNSDENAPKYEVHSGYKEIIFVAYGNDPNKTPLENRDIKTLNDKVAPYAFGQRLQQYKKISTLENHENIFLIEYSYLDHGGFVTSYGIIYDPKNDKILYDSEDLLNQEDHRFGKIEQISEDEIEVCYTINWYKDPDNRERICSTVDLFNTVE